MTAQIRRRSGPPPQRAAIVIHENTTESSSRSSRCERCRRGLTDPKSVAKSYGPVCWHRRHEAALRVAPMNCGCSDPWTCRCDVPPLSEHQIHGYADAARYILDTTGCTPMLPADVLRRLWQRGGDDRVLAEKIQGVIA